MDEDKIVKKETEGQRLNIDIGTKLMIKFEGSQITLKAVYVGMEPKAYLVMRLLKVAGLHDFIIEGNRVVIKYVSSGVVYGFQSVVQGYLIKKNLVLVLLAYPKMIEAYELRQEQRIDGYFPATLSVAGKSYHGFIIDLSPSGCRFAFGHSSGKLPVDISWGQEVLFSFQLLGREGVQQSVCKVRSVQHEDRSLTLGLQFEKLDTSVIEGIKKYVEEVSEFLEAS